MRRASHVFLVVAVVVALMSQSTERRRREFEDADVASVALLVRRWFCMPPLLRGTVLAC